MSDTDSNPDWWIDGVSLGSSPEAASESGREAEPEVAEAPAREGEGHLVPPRGVPATGIATTPIDGGAPPEPKDLGTVAAAGSAAATSDGGTGTLILGATPPGSADPQRRRWPVVALSMLVLVGIALVIYFVAFSGTAQYAVHVGERALSANGDTVTTPIFVSDVGSSPGAPTCTIHIAAGSGLGTGTFKERSVAPGKPDLYVNRIKVTGTGPLMVKSAVISATCG